MKRYLIITTTILIISVLAILAFMRKSNREESNLAKMRQEMVEKQIKEKGIRDERVLATMFKVKRHQFVPHNLKVNAYRDSSIPMGKDQLLPQPYITALMVEALQLNGDERVLEIGTKAGYQAAILAELAKEVYAVEISEDLTESIKKRLRDLGYKNISLRYGDAYLGWPAYAPYNVIIVNYAFEHIPQALIEQLAEDGRLLIGIITGDPNRHELTLISKREDKLEKVIISEVIFSIYPKQED